MRLSTRLLSNAATTFLRQGLTFALGLFTTWYILGAAGLVGFGLIALAVSSASLSRALEATFRVGLVRELATAIASGEARLIRRGLNSSFRLCLQVTLPLMVVVLGLAASARAGFFNTPSDRPELDQALAILIFSEGIHAAVRLLSAPYLQSLFAAQQVALDNLLQVVSRVSYALSAVIVFGWALPEADLDLQLSGFALSRVTLQLFDVVLGIWLAKRLLPSLRLERSAYDEAEYRLVRGTLWQSSQVTVLLNANAQFLAILINLVFGLTFNSLWQIVVQFAGFARMFFEGLLRGIAPLTTHLQEGGRMGAVTDLLTRSIRYQFALAFPTAVFLGLYARPLLDLWVGQRLAADPYLATAGISSHRALDLAANMAWVLLAGQILRGGFFGVERILYGIGKVKSYAWFAKWALLGAIGFGGPLMAWSRQPMVAPIALLVADTLYTGVLLRAARREIDLPVGATLRRCMARPLVVGLVFLALLAPTRFFLDRVTVISFGALLLGSALVNGVLTLTWTLEADERQRLVELFRQSVRRVPRRPG